MENKERSFRIETLRFENIGKMEARVDKLIENTKRRATSLELARAGIEDLSRYIKVKFENERKYLKLIEKLLAEHSRLLGVIEELKKPSYN